MKMRPILVTGVATAALTFTACGIATGSAGGTPGDDATSVSARQAAKDNTFTAMRDRAAGWEAAPARAGPRGGLGGDRPALSSDSGLAGCASLSRAHQVSAGDYPKIAAQFAGSRWPDLRVSGLAYVEIATKLLATHAYGGETVWFYQRLSAACAKHGRPLPF